MVPSEAQEHVTQAEPAIPAVQLRRRVRELHSVDDPGALVSGLTSCTDGSMEAYEVSTLFNSVAYDGPEVIARRESVA